EYELPRLMTAPHDVAGDSQGNIWFNSHRTTQIAVLDPRTGTSEEYKVPTTDGANPGQHWLAVDERDQVWFSENWSHKLGRLDPETGHVFEMQTPTPRTAPKRGGFDPDGNAWFGGAGGLLVKFDAKTHQLTEYRAPTPGVSFYECLPDKNGEIWAGELYAGRLARFNPKTDRWTEYVLPEPVSHNRRTWIDN